MPREPETLVPTDQLHDLLGISRPKLVAVGRHRRNLRVVRVNDVPYIRRSDLLALLDSEYEATEAPEVRGLAQTIRRVTRA